MSEIINNKEMRIQTMKELIKRLHLGETEEAVKKELESLLGQVDYSDVFIMENQLISEGIPSENIKKLCDVHTNVLRKHLDLQIPIDAIEGHPIHTFLQENKAIKLVTDDILKLVSRFGYLNDSEKAIFDLKSFMMKLHKHFNDLMDVDKHYSRKENLVFPVFERKGMPGPSTVMWGKDDEVRDMLKSVLEVLNSGGNLSFDEILFFLNQAVSPTATAINEMIYKEEKIFLPTAKELLTEQEWYEIYIQESEIGYCLYAPTKQWQPAGGVMEEIREISSIPGKIKLPSGTFDVPELIAMLNAMPFDITFVDKDDVVRFFTEGEDRIFTRTRAILGRKVQYCHPPDSVHIVEQIVNDFKSGKQNRARFWINFKGRFVYIVYYAVRDTNGNYLGTLEVTQDLTEARSLEGERRLLNY